MAHYDIFRDQLTIRYPGYGHALWEPSPGNLHVVGVGDVGYIHEGRFHRLFNILLPADDPSHARFGVPDNHEPFQPKVSEHITPGILPPDNFCSAGVALESAEDNRFATRPRDPGEVSFSCRGKQGAVLSLPIQAKRENTVARDGFGKWMIRHIDRWFAWALDRELGIERMEDIVLITGTDHARSWANVAFLGGQADARVSFGVEAAHSKVNWQFSPERKTGAAWNWGPCGENLPEDQCIFIRGFRARKRMIWRPKLKAAAGPNPDPEDDDCEPDAELILIPAVPKYRDPLHVLLEYLAEERPDCDVIVVHDDDLALLDGLGDGASLESLQPDVLLSCLRSSKLVIYEVLLGPGLSTGNDGANTDTEIVRVASLSAIFESQFLRISDSESNRMIATGPLQSPLCASELPTTDAMASPLHSPTSFPHVKQILDTALSEYKKEAGIDLLDHWLTKELETCHSVEAILDIVQHQAEAFDNFRAGDKRLMKWIGTSAHVLYKVSSTLGEGVGVALPAKEVFSGIGVLLATAKDVPASHDVLVDLFENIQFFLKRLGVHPRISPTRDMVEIIVKIVAEVLSILSIATKEMQQRRTKIYLKKPVIALERLDSLTREEVRMAIAQALETIKGLKEDVKKADEAVQRIKSAAGIQIEQDVRKWFSPPDPFVNYCIAYKSYHEDSVAWFLKGSIFKEWELIGSLIWIYGKPGSGKSILCTAIVKHVMSLRDAGLAVLAYHYFDFRDEEKQNLRNLLTSLLTQLFICSEPCWNILFRLYSTHGKGAQLPSTSVLINCLKEMLKVVAQQPVYIIIDALDECPSISGSQNPREVLLDFLKDLVDLHFPNLHICVSGRPEIDIKVVLEPLAYCTVSLHDESGQQKNISDYVRNKFYSGNNFFIQGWSEEEKVLVVEYLSKKADGMFSWVFRQLCMLRRCQPQSIRQTLQGLPSMLAETYERVLNQIPQVNQAPAHRLLQCLTVAARPLRVEELAEVLALDFDSAQGAIPRYREDWRPNGQVGAVLAICSSLITIIDDHGSQVFQFSHFTVKEFLTSHRLAGGPLSQYHILLEPAHTIFAQACLGSLLNLGGHVNEECVKDFPLAKYAAEHWVTHAQFQGVASRVKDGMKSLFDCDKPHFAAWVRIYNIDEESYGEFPSEIPTPLYYSSLCGFSDLVEHLAIKYPQQLNAIGGRYEFPLRAALFRKHVRVMKILLDRGANVHIRGTRERTILHEAITDVGIVRTLLNYGVDVKCQQDDLRTPLHLAACHGELGVARELLKHKANADSRDNRGNTPLHLLFEDDCRGDNVLDLAQLLLEHGADVNRRDQNNNTPLHLTMGSRMYDCAGILLEHGADANAGNSEGKTALHLLFENDYSDEEDLSDIARILLAHGADVNIRAMDEWVPLHWAALDGRLTIARLLLDHGAYVDAENELSETPLLLVSQGNYDSQEHGVGLARLLLDRGADIDGRAKNKWTPLHWAAFNGRLEITQLLLRSGANVNVENDFGERPLHLVSAGTYDSQEHGACIALLLLRHGAKTSARDEQYETPLHRSAFKGRLWITQALLDNGANVNANNDQGETPLHLVSRGKYDSQGHDVGIASLLLKHGADRKVRTKNDWTPLHSAVFNGKIKVVRVLLYVGANPNAKNDQGETPLHLVSRSNYIPQEHAVGIAKLLLEHGADANARDKGHATPLQSARYRGKLDIERVLLDHDAKAHPENVQDLAPLDLGPEDRNTATV